MGLCPHHAILDRLDLYRSRPFQRPRQLGAEEPQSLIKLELTLVDVQKWHATDRPR